jgi:hypothetical protein
MRVEELRWLVDDTAQICPAVRYEGKGLSELAVQPTSRGTWIFPSAISCLI